MTINDYQIILLFLMLLMFSHLYLLVKKGRQDLKGEEGLPKGKEMKPFLFLKLFYINPQDPRSFLPKVNPSFGWTVNFQNKTHAFVFMTCLILIIATALAMASAAIKPL